MIVPPRLVVDTSVALKWVLPEEGSDRAVLVRNAMIHAPPLFIAECANALWVRVRRRELQPDTALAAAALVLRAGVRIEPPAALEELLALAVDLDHPTYDCEYVSLGRRLGVPLVTADRRFAAKVRTVLALRDAVLTLDDLT